MLSHRNTSNVMYATQLQRQLPLLLPPLLGAVIVLLATSVHGAGVTADSVSYINAGAHLLAAAGIRHQLLPSLTGGYDALAAALSERIGSFAPIRGGHRAQRSIP